jgi:hypothetical protein
MTRPSLHDLLAELGPDDGGEAVEAPIDPRWARFAAGELSDDEAEALLAELGTEAEAEAFAPLGEDFVQSVTDRAMAALATDAAPAQVALPPLAPHPELPPPRITYRREPERPLSMWAWLRDLLRQPIFLAPALAMAVAMLFVEWAPPALPAYAVEVSSGDLVDRGSEAAPAGPPKLTDGSALVVVLRPEAAVAGVRGAVFLRTGGGWSPVDADIQVDGGGAARVRVQVSSAWPAGALELRVVLASGRAPGLDDVEGGQRGVEAFPLRVEHVVAAPGRP